MLSRQPLKSPNRSATAHSQEETAGVSCGLRTPANVTDVDSLVQKTELGPLSDVIFITAFKLPNFAVFPSR
jgi:hypothetical protein